MKEMSWRPYRYKVVSQGTKKHNYVIGLWCIMIGLMMMLGIVFIVPSKCQGKCTFLCRHFGGCLLEEDESIGFRTWPFLLSLWIFLIGLMLYGRPFYKIIGKMLEALVLALGIYMGLSVWLGHCDDIWKLKIWPTNENEPWICPIGTVMMFIVISIPLGVLICWTRMICCCLY